MKKIFLAIFITSLLGSAKAQLSNTRWTNKMFVPTLEDILINFKKDTVELQLADTREPIEFMTYSIKDSVIYLKKIFGGSPCDTNVEFTLIYRLSGDQLKLSNLADVCDERSKGWPKQPWVKIKK